MGRAAAYRGAADVVGNREDGGAGVGFEQGGDYDGLRRWQRVQRGAARQGDHEGGEVGHRWRRNEAQRGGDALGAPATRVSIVWSPLAIPRTQKYVKQTWSDTLRRLTKFGGRVCLLASESSDETARPAEIKC